MTTSQPSVSSTHPSRHDYISVFLDGTSPLSEDLISAMRDAADRAEDSRIPLPLVIYLRGTTAHDAHVHWPGQHASVQLATSWERELRRLERLQCPILGAADGLCSWLALEVLLCCDLRAAATNMCVRKGDEILGWPAMLLYRLAKELGVARARSLLFTRKDISARDAAELGLVNIVTHQLQSAISLQLSEIPSESAPIFRHLLTESFTMTYEDALGVHLASCEKVLRFNSTE